MVLYMRIRMLYACICKVMSVGIVLLNLMFRIIVLHLFLDLDYICVIIPSIIPQQIGSINLLCYTNVLKLK